MFRLVLSDRFKNSLKTFIKKHPELEPVFRERLKILQSNPKDTKLKTHKLTGKLKGYFAASITYEHRVVFHIEKNFIFLLAIGTHDEVY